MILFWVTIYAIMIVRHFGVYAQSVLPTGPRANTGTLFSPQIGNNRHFELGIGFSCHTVLFGTEYHNLALFFEGT